LVIKETLGVVVTVEGEYGLVPGHRPGESPGLLPPARRSSLTW
jgi:hypothetical protein